MTLIGVQPFVFHLLLHQLCIVFSRVADFFPPSAIASALLAPVTVVEFRVVIDVEVKRAICTMNAISHCIVSRKARPHTISPVLFLRLICCLLPR